MTRPATSPILSRDDLDGASLSSLTKACNLSSEAQIEDVYTAVHQQYGQLDDPRCQRFQIVLYLGPIIDLDRWSSTFRAVVASNPILRTRLAHFPLGLGKTLLQVLSNEPHITERFSEAEFTLEEYLAADQGRTLTYGDPLVRSAIVGRNFVLSIHHAVMDYWSITTLLQEDLILGYIAHPDPPPQRPPFKDFVKFLIGIDETSAKNFWGTRFSKQIPGIFPPVNKGILPSPDSKISKGISFQGRVGSTDDKISPAHLPAFVEAAWALTAAAYTEGTNGSGSDSVAYGLMLSGRSSTSAANIRVNTTFLGPAHAQVPVQVSLSSQQRASLTVEQFVRDRAASLRQLQSHPALQYGMERIAKVSETAAVAAKFQTLLNIIPAIPSAHQAKKEDEGTIRMDRIIWKVRASVALMLRCQILDDGIHVDARFDPSVMDECQLWRVLAQFEHVLHEMMAPGAVQKKLDRLPLLSGADRAEIGDWNRTLETKPAENGPMLLHGIFMAQAKMSPDAVAIRAGDDAATSYRELNQLSDRLARELRNRKIASGAFVPVVLGNSVPAVASILAILKAGALAVPLDPHSNPLDIKDAIACLSTQPTLVLASPKAYASLSSLLKGPEILAVTAEFLASLLEVNGAEYPLVAPNAPAIVYISPSPSNGLVKKEMFQVSTLEHRSLTSTLRSLVDRFLPPFSAGEKPRTLHSSPYESTISLYEIFLPFLRGGSLCIPPPSPPSSSPQFTLPQPLSLPPSPPPSPPASPLLAPSRPDANTSSGLANFISSTEVTAAFLQPRTLRSLSPNDVPSLQNILVPVSTDSGKLPKTWLKAAVNQGVRIFTSYESNQLLCTISDQLSASTSSDTPSAATNAGKPIPGHAIWIIQPGSTTKALAPIGSVGEVMVQSAGIASSAPDEKDHRFRTGDLAKYNPDGSIVLIGAPKNRVRLSRAGRSFTVQLEEVERRIVLLLESFEKSIRSPEVVALTKIAGGRTQIIAVVSCNGGLDDTLKKEVQQHANDEMPADLLPAAWLWLGQPLPRVHGGRVDRVVVKEWVKGWKG